MTIVGIDVSAIPAEPRGAGRYVVELVRMLDRHGVAELRLETRKSDGARWADIAPSATIAAVVPDGRVARLAWEQLGAPRFVDRWGVDVFHGPHYTMPEVAKSPKIVTIHDLTFFDHPELHEKAKVSFFKRAIRVAAQRADALVCVSEPTRRRLLELFEPSRVFVVPHGIDHSVFHPASSSDDEAILAGAGVDIGRWPYVLFVGTLEPRKDLPTLVRAFDRVAPSREDLRLVIAGGTGWANEAFERVAAASPHRDRIVRTGYVADNVIPVLMRGAEAVVYPAIEEGFGLPVLEALACGTPVITTAGSVMDEIAEGAARTFPARDNEALAAALAVALDDPSDRARIARGIAVASRYTWDATATAHEEIYLEVSGG